MDKHLTVALQHAITDAANAMRRNGANGTEELHGFSILGQGGAAMRRRLQRVVRRETSEET